MNYILILAVNYADMIIKKEKEFKKEVLYLLYLGVNIYNMFKIIVGRMNKFLNFFNKQ